MGHRMSQLERHRTQEVMTNASFDVNVRSYPETNFIFLIAQCHGIAAVIK